MNNFFCILIILASYIAIAWGNCIHLATTRYQSLFLPVKFSYSINSWQRPFYSHELFLFSMSHIFDNIIKTVKKKDIIL